LGLGLLHRELRVPDRAERRGAAIGGHGDRLAVRVRRPNRPRDGSDDRLLREHRSEDRLAGGGATALFIAGFGAAGYATRRDLSGVARAAFWALIGLIIFGIVAIFVQIPNSQLIYAIAGLAIFAVLTAFDFQRLRRSEDIRTAPLLAASIFLDILNVFLLLLSLFGRND
jgi:uncharacterized membrane protein YuzA (DUF378 family)